MSITRGSAASAQNVADASCEAVHEHSYDKGRVPGESGLQRYIFKNYLMRRNDHNVYEIPASAVTLVDAPLVWPVSVLAVPGVTTAELLCAPLLVKRGLAS